MNVANANRRICSRVQTRNRTNVHISRSIVASLLILFVRAFAQEQTVVRNQDAVASSVTDKERSFWSFQPLKEVAPPPVQNKAWPRTPLDHFVVAKLEERGLTPNPPAHRGDLIRRVYFDLIGLPPSPEEIQTFIEDASTDAYERLVDRLLNSPHCGERWGQHWLDVVRYAETEGFEYDRNLPDGWRYRDYVIRSFNEDKPYDRFIMEQLAGDELAPDDREMQIAAGFHRLGPVRRNAGNQDVTSSRNEVLTERTDVIGAAFIGLTIGCARCHDHKFDPIPQKDYYRMQAFLASTEENDIDLATKAEHAAWKARTDEINKDIKDLKERLKGLKGEEAARMRQKIQETEDRLPPPLPALASVRDDEKQRTSIHVLKRGDWENKGDRVGMRGLEVLLSKGAAELPPETKHPRTALARWIADPSNPLTSRVMVNRIWQHHFGAGIVKTANDFGANGDRPSHPELLDYLANQLIAHGWRLKPIHRMICLSSAYQQSSRSPQAKTAGDPENRLLGHFGKRRLAAEEIRDAMLSISGVLNRKAGGPSVILPVDEELVSFLYKPSQWAVNSDKNEHYRRSIYLIAKRNLRLPFMEVFDQPALLTSCARRESSTHAPQTLELLNGQTANALAARFGERLVCEAGTDPAQQVKRAYWLAVGRAPQAKEMQLALQFLATQPLKEFALAMFNLNEFLYVR